MWLGWYAGSVFQVGLASGCRLTVFLCSVHGMTWAYTANADPLGGILYADASVSICVYIHRIVLSLSIGYMGQYHLYTMLTFHSPLTFVHYLLTFSVLSDGKDSTGSQSSERPVQSGTPGKGKGVVGCTASVYCMVIALH